MFREKEDSGSGRQGGGDGESRWEANRHPNQMFDSKMPPAGFLTLNLRPSLFLQTTFFCGHNLSTENFPARFKPSLLFGTDPIRNQLAEREGFEPSEGLLLHRFSKPAL
jgi:hypothetical protein